MGAHWALLAAAALGLAAAAGAQPLAAAVTDDIIEVSSDFRGAKITVFGVQGPQQAGGDLVVTVRGPGAPVTIMRKRRIAGLWLNTDPVRFAEAPGFFAIVSARPVREAAGPREIWAKGLDPTAFARFDGPTPADADPAAYRAALVRLMSDKGLYQEQPRALSLRPGGLFRADIRLPPNAPPGAYAVSVHHFVRGRALDSETTAVLVSRTGVERRIYDLAVKHPLLHGFLAAGMAIAAGWAAALAFRRT